MIHETLRDRRRDATANRIADAALALIGEGGLEALTMPGLARAVDFTPGALYRYFPSKDALVAELNRRVLVAQREALAAAWAAPVDVPARDRALLDVLLAATLLARAAHERPAEFSLVALTMAEPRRLVANDADAVHVPELVGLLGDLAGRLAEAAEAGALSEGDARDRALLLVFGGLGVLTLRKLHRFDPTLDPLRLAALHARGLLAGFGASPADLDRLAPLASFGDSP